MVKLINLGECCLDVLATFLHPLRSHADDFRAGGSCAGTRSGRARASLSTSRDHAQQPAQAMDCIAVEHDLAKVCVFAPPLAELAAPPTVRHHPEWPAAMITDLARPHCSSHRAVSILDRGHDALARSWSTETATSQ